MTEKVADGLPLKAIAAKLRISPHTAATYLARARRKLEQSSRWTLAVAISGPLPRFRDLFEERTPVQLAAVDFDLGDYVLAGLSNAEIARRTGTSTRAAARSVQRLLRLIGLPTRSDLIAAARKLGIAGMNSRCVAKIPRLGAIQSVLDGDEPARKDGAGWAIEVERRCRRGSAGTQGGSLC